MRFWSFLPCLCLLIALSGQRWLSLHCQMCGEGLMTPWTSLHIQKEQKETASSIGGGAEMLFYRREQFNKKSKCAYGSQHFFNITCKKWIWSSDWDSCSRSLCFFLSNVISSSSLARCPSARVSRRVSWTRIISFTSPYLLSSARSSSVKIRSFSSNTLWDECWNEKNSIDEIGPAHSQISFTIPVKQRWNKCRAPFSNLRSC